MALFFGSLRPSKGLHALLRAWGSVAAALPEARLVVAGRPYRGTDTEELASVAEAAGAAASVLFRFDEFGSDEANFYYRAADVVVLPYQRITTSAVLRYAYSSGRPVVATSVGEHQDHVNSAVGWLVPPDDAPALAQALIAALSDPVATAARGRAALDYATKHFDWADIARKTIEAYAMVIKRRSSAW